MRRQLLRFLGTIPQSGKIIPRLTSSETAKKWHVSCEITLGEQYPRTTYFRTDLIYKGSASPSTFYAVSDQHFILGAKIIPNLIAGSQSFFIALLSKNHAGTTCAAHHIIACDHPLSSPIDYFQFPKTKQQISFNRSRIEKTIATAARKILTR